MRLRVQKYKSKKIQTCKCTKLKKEHKNKDREIQMYTNIKVQMVKSTKVQKYKSTKE